MEITFFIPCFIDALVPSVGISGSCEAMIRTFYQELLKGHPQQVVASILAQKTFEFSEFLVDRLGVVDLRSRFPAKVTFHDGCHG